MRQPTRFQRLFIPMYLLMVIVVLMGACVMKCHGQTWPPNNKAEAIFFTPEVAIDGDSIPDKTYLLLPGGYSLSDSTGIIIIDTTAFIASAQYWLPRIYKMYKTAENRYWLASDILRTINWDGYVTKSQRAAFIKARNAYTQNK